MSPTAAPLHSEAARRLPPLPRIRETAAIGTVSGKIYPITVRNVPQAAKVITLTVKKRGFVDTAIGPIAVQASGNPGPQVKTIAYALTSTVRGKVTTPAGKIRQGKRLVLTPAPGTRAGTYRNVFFDDTKAQVWASTDPDNKVTAAADGSYSLSGVKHSGTFTVIAEYTAGDGNYKTSDPQTVSTTAPAYTQNIALKYGYTTTITVQAVIYPTGGSPIFANGVTIRTEVEGREVARGQTSGTAKNYVVDIDHPGAMIMTASFTGYRSHSQPINTTRRTFGQTFILTP